MIVIPQITLLDGDEALCNEIKRLSLVAWQHFNMLETFTFCKSEKLINIHEVAKLLLEDEPINAGAIPYCIRVIAGHADKPALYRINPYLKVLKSIVHN